MMFSIEMDLCTVTKYLFKIIETADVYGIAVGIHPRPAEYMNPTGAAKEMACFS
tara:strand:+ start:58 stop:219 length:162 start_codon:yes stop_codon:yes gene_type:complete